MLLTSVRPSALTPLTAQSASACLGVQDGGPLQAAPQRFLGSTLVCDEGLQHGSHHVELRRRAPAAGERTHAAGQRRALGAGHCCRARRTPAGSPGVWAPPRARAAAGRPLAPEHQREPTTAYPQRLREWVGGGLPQKRVNHMQEPLHAQRPEPPQQPRGARGPRHGAHQVQLDTTDGGRESR